MSRIPFAIGTVALALASSFSSIGATAPLVSLPRATHPGAGQTLYFVLPDRFENGSATNDRGGAAGGDRETHGFDPTSIQYFHGGDFAGLTARLDYLHALGVTTIWVTPPLRNKPVQFGSAGYHGYWITDFLAVDPHLGSDAEFRAFIAAAHARGLRVCMDIVLNHTADVIQFQDGNYQYRNRATFPYRNASGVAFDERTVAFNGLTDPAAFPALATAVSFAHVPFTTPADATAKNPAWLNDLTLYHNRGNSTFTGEDSVHGDFGGLDDLFTEHPAVVQGFIEIFTHWLTEYDLDGFRIDTVKHANVELWQAFAPAIRAAARAHGRPDFLHFGEVYSGDVPFLSQWTTAATLDAVLDFGFAFAARDFVSRGQGSGGMAAWLDHDDRYTDHDGNAHTNVTFLGNHDMGRFGLFLRSDNPAATDAQLVDLMELGHGLLFLVRGQPVIYYGDEQGMIGSGGDTGAREDMFATQAPAYAGLARIGTSARGAVAKFDEAHPLFRTLTALAALRREHAALRTGAMLARATSAANVFAFSRIERDARIEYVVALNNARSGTTNVTVPTAQPVGAILRRVFDSRSPADPGNAVLTADAQGGIALTLEPLQFAVWRADAELPAPAQTPTIVFATPSNGAVLNLSTETVDGQTFPTRVELRANVIGASDYAEVTFALARPGRAEQCEILGVDDAPPYRVHWRPPADLAAGTLFSLIATVDNRRGGRASAQIDNITVTAVGTVAFGIKASTTPAFTQVPAASTVYAGAPATLTAAANGSGPVGYQWFKDGTEISGATEATFAHATATPADAGTYAVLARNLAGSTISAGVTLAVVAPPAPVISEQPVGATVDAGGAVTLRVAAIGVAPLAYQWFRDGVAIAGANAATLTLPSTQRFHAGAYHAEVSVYGVAATSDTVTLAVNPPPASEARLLNLSTRALAQSGANVLIPGFVVQGPGSMRLLIRAVGPTLDAPPINFGGGTIPDPVMSLLRFNFATNAYEEIAANDDWATNVNPGEIVTTAAQVSAFALQDARDAALLVDLPAGQYSVIARDKAETSGIAIVELYDADASNAGARLINLSNRGFVGTGSAVMIPGFVISADGPKTVLLRVVGPGLAAYNVPGVMTDPQLSVYRRDPVSGAETLLFTNDNWSDHPDAAFTAQTGAELQAFALADGSADAALVATLQPGVYTVIGASADGVGTGVVLVELYVVP